MFGALSPLDGRYLSTVAPLRMLWSEEAFIQHRLHIEVEWLIALAQETTFKHAPSLSAHACQKLRAHVSDLDQAAIDAIRKIEGEVHHDVKACEYYLRSWCQKDPELSPLCPFIHFACTSEDINNLSYALMLKKTMLQIIIPTLESLLETWVKWSHTHADLAMLSRTHGQIASPTTLGKEMSIYAHRLQSKLESIKNTTYFGKINGAVGNFNAHYAADPQVNWQDLNARFIQDLGLTPNPYTTQIEPQDGTTELYHHLHHINRILTDLSQDFWGYISLGYFKQLISANQVGSSTMPHKINPIHFENAEGNLATSNALFHLFQERLPCSRWQRDLSNSTVLRNQGVAFGHMLLALKNLEKGFSKLSPNQEIIKDDLSKAWALMAEPIQTILKLHGHEDAYETLRVATQGQHVTQEIIHACIDDLPLSDDVKQQLKSLSPLNYLGHAKEMAQVI